MPAPIKQLLKVGFSYPEAAALHTLTRTTTANVARTTVRVATAAAATVLPVGSVANLAVGDTVVIARGTAVAETRTITAVDATAAAETITVAALTNAHAVGEAVEEVVTSPNPASLAQFVEAGFSTKRGQLLRAGSLDMKKLLVQGKFTRAQAKLILAP